MSPMSMKESGPNLRPLDDGSKLPGVKAAMAEAEQLAREERAKMAADARRAAASARQVARLINKDATKIHR